VYVSSQLLADGMYFMNVWCSWTTIDIKPVSDSNPYVEVMLDKLDAFTKYAVYVQMYTISNAQSAAMSPIKYFTTAPGS
jgi:hypothetical protein